MTTCYKRCLDIDRKKKLYKVIFHHKKTEYYDMRTKTVLNFPKKMENDFVKSLATTQGLKMISMT